MAYQPEVEKLEKQYQTNPDQYFAPLADAYRKAGNLDFALDIVRNGLAKRPNYLSAHIVLGRCLLDQKNDPEAAKVFEQVLVLDAENIIALRYLGEISERSGDGAGAQRWLRRLLDVDPMNDDAMDALKRLEASAPAASTAAPEVPAASAEAPPEPAAVEEPAAVAGFESTVMDAPEPAAVAPERVAEPTPVPSDTAANDFGIEQASSPFDTPVENVGAGMSNFGMEPTDVTFSDDGQPVAGGGGASLDLQPPEPEMVANFDELPPAAAPAEAAAEPEAPASFEPPMLAFDQPAAPPEPEAPAEAAEEPAPEPVRSRKSAPAPTPSFGPTADLPLIMPDDLDQDAQPVGSPGDALEPEPVITETMADVYVRQGLYSEAKEVYHKLIQQRPGDHALRAKLAKLEQHRPTPARGMMPTIPAPANTSAKTRFAAADTGGVSARSFFGKVLASKPGAPPLPPPPPITPGSGSAMDAAFADEPAPARGAPTRPTSDELSLAEVFGEDPVSASPPAPPAPKINAPPTPPGPGTPGFSFDEFFGNKPGASSPPPPAESGTEGGDGSSPDDFVSWLKGLKS